ncbi:NAD(P)-binding protein [Parathielavia appendiculata]|uniref:NAD(P)-binding protein n=1 Tax=Parathielavia appendiculata TaxID=2587402 RepID=A0AAN6TTA0_9PEZI|nr:NAD(P)-binding protein [Parathielavia appendiculata]
MSIPKRTILFLGATGGVGLSALRRSLAADHTCIALCRNPSKLASAFPSSNPPPNLHLVEGNAHDADTLARCLRDPSSSDDRSSPVHVVDTVVFSIGALPTLTGMTDPHVCEKGMTALLEAVRRVREEDKNNEWRGKKLRLVAVSTTGISQHVRDVPLLFLPLYKILLHTPHKDKVAMERLVMGSGAEEGVEWTIVRGSLYTSGPATEGLVREGMEDPVSGVVEEGIPVGYTISREDVGKWVFENVIQGGGRWIGKAAVITY